MLLLLHRNCILHLMTSFLILLDLPKVIDQQWQTSVNFLFVSVDGLVCLPIASFTSVFSPLFQWLYSLLWRVTKIQNSHSRKSYFLLLQLLCESESCSVVSSSLQPHRRYSEEGNGTPLQYSCLENPRDGGAWWVAVFGVAQSQTQLKRLSSSSSSRWYSPRDSPGQNTGVGTLSILHGIFTAQGSNPGLLHSRQILYQLSHKGSPRVLEWVACPFSRGSSHPRNQTGVSCIAGRFFTKWPIKTVYDHQIYFSIFVLQRIIS